MKIRAAVHEVATAARAMVVLRLSETHGKPWPSATRARLVAPTSIAEPQTRIALVSSLLPGARTSKPPEKATIRALTNNKVGVCNDNVQLRILMA